MRKMAAPVQAALLMLVALAASVAGVWAVATAMALLCLGMLFVRVPHPTEGQCSISINRIKWNAALATLLVRG